MDETATLFNLPIIRRALIPAATVHMAQPATWRQSFRCCWMAECTGKNLLLPETVARAVQSGFNGWDSYLKENIHWGHGFILGGGIRPPGSNPRKGFPRLGQFGKNLFGHGDGNQHGLGGPASQAGGGVHLQWHAGREACPARWAAISNGGGCCGISRFVYRNQIGYNQKKVHGSDGAENRKAIPARKPKHGILPGLVVNEEFLSEMDAKE